jgi:hypothetical protein
MKEFFNSNIPIAGMFSDSEPPSIQLVSHSKNLLQHQATRRQVNSLLALSRLYLFGKLEKQYSSPGPRAQNPPQTALHTYRKAGLWGEGETGCIAFVGYSLIIVTNCWIFLDRKNNLYLDSNLLLSTNTPPTPTPTPCCIHDPHAPEQMMYI